jgi:hypothetical protein
MEGALEASRLLHGSRVRRAQLSERLLGAVPACKEVIVLEVHQGQLPHVSGNGLAVNIIAKVPRGSGFGPQPEYCCQALPLSKRQEGIDYGSAYQKEASPKRREKLHD